MYFKHELPTCRVYLQNNKDKVMEPNSNTKFKIVIHVEYDHTAQCELAIESQSTEIKCNEIVVRLY